MSRTASERALPRVRCRACAAARACAGASSARACGARAHARVRRRVDRARLGDAARPRGRRSKGRRQGAQRHAKPEGLGWKVGGGVACRGGGRVELGWCQGGGGS
eukprot:6208185-Pleurochrysis_carterae.AAC.1